MYKIGEFVVYGNEGVCQVEEISKRSIPGINIKKDYYTLKPMHDNSMIYAPTDTPVFMRPIVTTKEIKAMIRDIQLIDEEECNLKNAKMIQDYYKKLLGTHQCIDLLTLLVSIKEKKKYLITKGKKLGQIEEKYLKAVKNLLEDEFSIVLGIPKEEIEQYIYNEIN